MLDLHVCLVTLLVAERLVADGANDLGTTTKMKSAVVGQSTSLHVSLWAELALECLDAGVGRTVLTEMGCRLECLVAFRARESRLPRMAQLVGLEIALSRVALAARGAAPLLPRIVQLHMLTV